MQIKDAHYKRSAVFSFLLRPHQICKKRGRKRKHVRQLTLTAHSRISILRTVIRDVFVYEIVIVSSNAISCIENTSSVVPSLLRSILRNETRVQ